MKTSKGKIDLWIITLGKLSFKISNCISNVHTGYRSRGGGGGREGERGKGTEEEEEGGTEKADFLLSLDKYLALFPSLLS